MNKQEIITKIRQELTKKENQVLDSMLEGDSVSKTAEKLKIPDNYARSFRKTVYEFVEELIDLGEASRSKQKKLIEFFTDNKTVVKISAAEEPQRVTIKSGDDIKPVMINATNPPQIVTVTTDGPVTLIQEEPKETPNFLVLNPYKHCPNKIYKSYELALEDAKIVAKKEQQRTYVLRIETVITPHCSFDVEDVSKTGIKDTHFVHNFF